MRKAFRIIALLVVILTIIAVAGCTSTVSDIRQNSKSYTPRADAKKTAPIGTKPHYFFINGSLLGSYANDGWYSLCDTDNSDTGGGGNSKTFYAQELLNQNSYYVYENNKLVGVSKQIIWLTEVAYCLGGFETKDAPQKFKDYGRLYQFEGNSDTSHRIFDLPVKLKPELSKLKIPDYSFNTDFVFGSNWERRSSSDRLVTNNGANLFPRNLTYGVEPTPEGNQSLIDLFAKNDMENTIPDFTECVLGDFDNDGNNEYLMFAESPSSESGYKLLCSNGKTDHLGIFNVIFYQEDNGNIQTIYSDLRPYNGTFEADKHSSMELSSPDYCIRIDLFTIADLNSDGLYEIGITKNEWEGGFYLVNALNTQGEYEVVMRSNFGM